MLPPRLAAHESAPNRFVVVSPGRFLGRSWQVGEVVVCAGHADDDDVVILVAAGLGRPRFGSLRNGDLHGDAGEPCSRRRWVNAGRVMAVGRVDGTFEEVGLSASAASWGTPSAGGRRRRKTRRWGAQVSVQVAMGRRPEARSQLGLFEARAAA